MTEEIKQNVAKAYFLPKTTGSDPNENTSKYQDPSRSNKPNQPPSSTTAEGASKKFKATQEELTLSNQYKNPVSEKDDPIAIIARQMSAQRAAKKQSSLEQDDPVTLLAKTSLVDKKPAPIPVQIPTAIQSTSNDIQKQPEEDDVIRSMSKKMLADSKPKPVPVSVPVNVESIKKQPSVPPASEIFDPVKALAKKLSADQKDKPSTGLNNPETQQKTVKNYPITSLASNETQKITPPASKKPVPIPLPLPPSKPSLVKAADPKPNPKPKPVPVPLDPAPKGGFVFGNIGNPADLPPSARTQDIPGRVPVPVPVTPELQVDEMVVVEPKEKTLEVSLFPITLWVVPSNTNDPDHFTRVPLVVTEGVIDETNKEIKLTFAPRRDEEDEEWLGELKTKRHFFYSNEKKTRKVWYGRDNIMNTRFDLTIEQSDGPIHEYFYSVMTSESDQPVPVSFSDLIVTQPVSVTNQKTGVQETQTYIVTFNSTEHVFDLINGETE